MSTKKIVILGVIAVVCLLSLIIIICLVTGLPLETILRPYILPTVPMLPRVFLFR